MIPQTTETTLTNVEFETLPSLTYALNIDTNRIHGTVDGIDAVRQAIYLILCTERYKYLIYSWNYGTELAQLIGQPIALVLPEIQRCITEALLQDDRITGVNSFDFEVKEKKVHCSFTVNTIFGEIQSETEVAI